ncbi:BCL2-interacting killer (Apoptosis-inducing) [Scophthalmus maximus]|uniref:BCL2-interacting killer (Apoptosis-inducing) n=1 Tax=Scophthalmus maximus TaxID=52904 RepID=A0A2U9B2H4_SCOMX|nr:BCL2-interacting killer (Apoptosis-inducing) [Scophthalmus maximus]KAF0029794.1 hypothetical protein F2P81_018899 [Scophthalmus maximus]
MVEQTRQPRRVVSLQAGPGEVDTGALYDVNLRISDRTVRAFARQLAAIGDQLDREWTGRRASRLPTPLHMLRPAQALTRTMYRATFVDICVLTNIPAGKVGENIWTSVYV